MLPRCVDGTFAHDWHDADVTGYVQLEAEQRCAACGARRFRYRSTTDTPIVRYGRAKAEAVDDLPGGGAVRLAGAS